MTPNRQRGHGALLYLLLLTTIGTGCSRPRLRLDPALIPGTTVRIQFGDDLQIHSLELEDYIVGSVLAEADIRGLDVEQASRVIQTQAILARTYALFNRGRHGREGFDLCATTHCQVYRPLETMSNDAVRLATAATHETAGLVLSYEGHTINAVYHADCGGETSAATVAWGGISPPYLRGVVDPYCQLSHPPPWRFEIDRSVLLDALQDDPARRIGTRLHNLQVAERDESGRVVRAVLEGNEGAAEIRGEELRRVISLRFGAHSLKSTRFSIQLDGNRVIFEGRGFGHGVGLCQRGTVERLKAGHAAETVLTFYYPGTKLTRYY